MIDQWKTVERDGPPTCDGEAVFVGFNSVGYSGCFNYVDRGGNCWMLSPEQNVCVMGDLRHWQQLDCPLHRSPCAITEARAYCDRMNAALGVEASDSEVKP